MGELLAFPGRSNPSSTTITCPRCGVPLQVAPTRNPANHPAAIRFAMKPEGGCRACVVMEWIHEVWPLCGIGALTLDALRLPHVQAQVDRILQAAGSDPEPTPWSRVIETWNLPRLSPSRPSRGRR